LDKQNSKPNKQKEHGNYAGQGKNSYNNPESKKDSGQDRCDDTKSWKS